MTHIDGAAHKDDFDAPLLWSDNTLYNWTQIGDFNGDGRDDMMRHRLGHNNLGIDMWLSTGSSFAASEIWAPEVTLPGALQGRAAWHIGDFNGDGKDDVFRYLSGESGADIFLSSGTDFVAAGSWTDAWNGDHGWYIGDFNGDGKDDMFRYLMGTSGADMFLSTGVGFEGDGSWTTAGCGAGYGGSGSGFVEPGQPRQGWQIGDFNGDGMDDLFRILPGESGADMWLSTGSEFVHAGSWTDVELSPYTAWHIGDFNGDGMDDILRYLEGTSGADVFLSTGTAFVHDGNWTPAGNGIGDWNLGDFNGDLTTDLLRMVQNVGTEVLL